MPDLSFIPDWASPPGATILDILEERSLTSNAFAGMIGCSEAQTKDLIEGRSPLTIDIARRLSSTLGASVEFWISRDYQYHEDVERLQAPLSPWLAELPVADMIRFGWLSPAPAPVDLGKACLDFFGVGSLGEWQGTYGRLPQTFSFRTSASHEPKAGAVAAWLRRAELEAEQIECAPWDKDQFVALLPRLRALTQQADPARFLPALRAACAACGVAVVSVRSPDGCRASGATRFLSPNKALLALSFRHLTDDHVWFTFFHEAAHLILHGPERMFVEAEGAPNTREEDEANAFAAQALIPDELVPALMKLPVNARTVIRFAVEAGVSPGIVVGQLQHRRRLRPNQLNKLKRHYVWGKEGLSRGTR